MAVAVGRRRRRGRSYPRMRPMRKVEIDPFDLAAERLYGQARRVVQDALGALPDAVDLEHLAEAIRRGSGDAAAAALDATAVEEAFAPLADVLLRTVQRAGTDEGEGGRARVKARVVLEYGFDLTDPAAIRWARSRSAALVVEIDSATRQAIRILVARALREGGHPYTVAREIRSLIGLHSRWAAAVFNHRARLVEQGLSASRVEELSGRYYQKLLHARAKNIARTEILRSANAGKRLAWKQAWRDGLLGQTKPWKEWVAAGDAEPGCAAVDGTTVRFDQEFSTVFGNLDMPPAHPGCRCTAALVFVEAPPKPVAAPAARVPRVPRVRVPKPRAPRAQPKAPRAQGPQPTAPSQPSQPPLPQGPTTVTSELGGGVDGSYVGQVGGRTVAIKPAEESFSMVTGDIVRAGVPKGAEAANEMAASIVNQALGNVVRMAPVEIRDVAGYGRSAVIGWVDDATSVATSASMVAPSAVEARGFALFDSIIGNLDRHMGNVMVDNLKQFWAIDHGLAFPAGAARAQEIARGAASEWGNWAFTSHASQAGRTLLADEMTALKSLLGSEATVTAELEAAGLSKGAVASLWNRVRWLTSQQRIPSYREWQGFLQS